jgi:hypothetical protein
MRFGRRAHYRVGRSCHMCKTDITLRVHELCPMRNSARRIPNASLVLFRSLTEENQLMGAVNAIGCSRAASVN